MTSHVEGGPLERFDVTSLVPKDDRYAVLRDLVPEAFSELDLSRDDLAVAMGQRVVRPQEGAVWAVLAGQGDCGGCDAGTFDRESAS